MSTETAVVPKATHAKGASFSGTGNHLHPIPGPSTTLASSSSSSGASGSYAGILPLYIGGMENRRTTLPAVVQVPILLNSSTTTPSNNNNNNRLQNIGDVAASMFSRSTMSLHLRRLVSKKKKRFQEGDFDLDLSYIIEGRLIAMGYPAESLEGCYRNRMDEVVKLFLLRHRDNYKVYNLCSERSYEPGKFENRVECFPFDDHNPPEFAVIARFCASVKEWLDANPQHVAAVHCKAGKGRTGLMVCAFLMHEYNWDAVTAMRYYADKRTSNSKGVTIPSQRRYIYYYDFALRRNLNYSPTPLQLVMIEVRAVPTIGTGNSVVVQFTVHEGANEVYASDCHQWKRHCDVNTLRVTPGPVDVRGDVRIVFYHRSKLKGNKPSCLFQMWMNTFFIIQAATAASSSSPSKCVMHPEAGLYQEMLLGKTTHSPVVPVASAVGSGGDGEMVQSKTPQTQRRPPGRPLVPPPPPQKGSSSGPSNSPCPPRTTAGVSYEPPAALISAPNPMLRWAPKAQSATLGSGPSLSMGSTSLANRPADVLLARHVFRVTLNKFQLDGSPRKDASHKTYPEHFRVTLYWACVGCSRCLSSCGAVPPTSSSSLPRMKPSNEPTCPPKAPPRLKKLRRSQTSSSQKLHTPSNLAPPASEVKLRAQPPRERTRKRRSSMELALEHNPIQEKAEPRPVAAYRYSRSCGSSSASCSCSSCSSSSSSVASSSSSSRRRLFHQEANSGHQKEILPQAGTLLRTGSDSCVQERLAQLWSRASRVSSRVEHELLALEASDGVDPPKRIKKRARKASLQTLCPTPSEALEPSQFQCQVRSSVSSMSSHSSSSDASPPPLLHLPAPSLNRQSATKPPSLSTDL